MYSASCLLMHFDAGICACWKPVDYLHGTCQVSQCCYSYLTNKGWGNIAEKVHYMWELSQTLFEVSQYFAFFCIPDHSVSVYGVTTSSSHNSALHNPVNLLSSAPHSTWETWVVLLPIFILGAMTGSGWQEDQISWNNFMKMLKITTLLGYRSWGCLSALPMPKNLHRAGL